MEITIIGNRSSTASWLAAQQLPLSEIPPLTPEDRAEAEDTGAREEDLARAEYAIALTGIELSAKVRKIAKPMLRWVSDNQIAAEIRRATLNTLEGKLRFEFDTASGPTVIEMEEKLVDDILMRGSREASEALARLLAFNLGDVKLAVAS